MLDYVRTHGKDRETLNVVNVVDDTRQLIDDICIREFLLAPLQLHVHNLMDHQFVTPVVVDVIGLVIYFTVAVVVLHGTLL